MSKLRRIDCKSYLIDVPNYYTKNCPFFEDVICTQFFREFYEVVYVYLYIQEIFYAQYPAVQHPGW